MAESNQYLRIVLRGADFLLPSEASLAIEQRQNLVLEPDRDNPVTAWRVGRTERWPASRLGRDLERIEDDEWERAVFLHARPYPVGLIVDDVQMLPRMDVDVEPLGLLGTPPTPAGHLFGGTWVRGNRLTLVFAPAALVAYLYRLGGAR